VLLSELLQEDVVKIGLQATNKREAIEELVDVLVAAHEIRLGDRAQVIDAVLTRERSASTGLKYGLAVPHGAVECVQEIVAVLGTSRAGIPFESVDNEPARLLVLLVIPKNTYPRHVRTLAGVARLATDVELRTRLLEAVDPAQIIAAIDELERR
jgi:mannitol/fructose-specific phosphotransferase system IIA component (Ntr-type)